MSHWNRFIILLASRQWSSDLKHINPDNGPSKLQGYHLCRVWWIPSHKIAELLNHKDLKVSWTHKCGLLWANIITIFTIKYEKYETVYLWSILKIITICFKSCRTLLTYFLFRSFKTRFVGQIKIAIADMCYFYGKKWENLFLNLIIVAGKSNDHNWWLQHGKGWEILFKMYHYIEWLKLFVSLQRSMLTYVKFCRKPFEMCYIWTTYVFTSKNLRQVINPTSVVFNSLLEIKCPWITAVKGPKSWPFSI